MIKLDVGIVARALVGQNVCGDAGRVWESEGAVLAALADGLGHGPEAAVAASTFLACIAEHVDDGLEELLRTAGVALSGTRGAAVALARFELESRRMWFSGIGNIECRASSRERIAPVSVAGILGRPLRKTKVYEYNVAPGDLIVLHSDGVSRAGDLAQFHGIPARTAAERIVDAWGKVHDDASCIVVSCRE